MIRIAIAGAAGRMGKALVACTMRAEDLELVAAIEQPGHPAIGRDAGEEAGVGPARVNLSDSVSGIAGAHVVIVFTLHDAVPDLAAAAAREGAAMVIGTTGLDDAETDAVRRAAERVAVVWAPNMSLGVNLLFAVATKAASVLGPGYSVEIDETHHVHKKDAPSGTALRLGERVAEGRGIDFGDNMVHVPDDEQHDATQGKIVIRSHREGEVVGNHTVSFENEAERVELTHRARSRDALALGTLHAARWTTDKPPGLYDMQHVLGL